MDNSKHLAESLMQLVEINSHTPNVKGVNEVGVLVKKMLEDCDLEWQEFEPAQGSFGKMLYAKSKNWSPALPHVMLTGHLDTVFPDHNGFDIRIEDGKLYGPGTVDMKAGLIVIIEAIKKMQVEGKLQNISILFTSEEEVNDYRAFPQIADLVKDVDYLMVFEGEGSNDPGDESKEKYLVIERKGIIFGKLTAKAIGGHSGVLGERKDRHSAVHELAYQIANIIKLADFEKGSTTNVGIFTGGTAANALAQSAEIRFDARMKTIEEHKRISQAFLELVNNKQDSEVGLVYEQLIEHYPLPYTDQSKRFFEFIKEAGKALNLEIKEQSRGGGSDANRLFRFNSNIAVLDNFGPTGGGEHTTAEYVNLESIERNINFTAAVLRKLLA